ASGVIFSQPWLGRGMAVGDIDNDGRLDAVVTTNDGPVHIVRNETPTQNHWLKLKLVGHKSNRDAIGAEVRLVTSKSQQFATVSTAGSYLSSSDKRVHFGLGPESVAQSIEIRWPSGIRQTLKNVSADQILQVDEPLPGSPPAAGTSPKCARPLSQGGQAVSCGSLLSPAALPPSWRFHNLPQDSNPPNSRQVFDALRLPAVPAA